MVNTLLNEVYNLSLEDEKVLFVCSDTRKMYYKYNEKIHNQFIDMGIAENNLVGISCGLASCGKIPFVYAVAPFLAYRAHEFIRDDVCMQNRNVKIVAYSAGMDYCTSGPTHHTTEDIAVIRVLPNITFFSPATPLEVKNVVRAAYKIDGPVYIRLGRATNNEFYNENYDFKVGKGVMVKDGKDITFISTGTITCDVLKAAEILERNNISVRVINIHTIKPFDDRIVIKAAMDTKVIITVEEHNIIGGLGGAVSEVIADNNLNVKFKRMGLEDCFAKGYGNVVDIKRNNGLYIDDIVTMGKRILQ